MKGLYYKILLTGAVTFTILSCQSKQDIDDVSLPETDYDTFYATIDELGTKVYADENQKILWDGDDLISIFNKNTAPNQYRFSGSQGSNSGTFVKVPQEGIASGNDLNLIYAVYPYSENTTINNDGVITLNLPAEQHFRDKTFGPGANTMVSVTDNNKLRFKNAVGYLVLKLYGSDVYIKNITLTGNNHEKLAGKATVSMGLGELPILTMDESATESVSLASNNIICGTTESKCTEFWFAIPPVIFSNGFTITITNFDGAVYTASNSRYLAIERNSIYRMEALEVTPDYSQFTFHDFMTSDGSRPAMITFNQSWWGEVHSAYIKYYEVDGIRYCKTFDEEGDLSGSATPGPGFWGNNGDVHLHFVWNASTNYIDIPVQYIGYDYQGDPSTPVNLYDCYGYYNVLNSTYAGSWATADDFYNANSSMLEKRSYYDGNGGFYLYVEWYYMIGLGGWHPATFDIVGVAEGYTR